MQDCLLAATRSVDEHLREDVTRFATAVLRDLAITTPESLFDLYPLLDEWKKAYETSTDYLLTAHPVLQGSIVMRPLTRNSFVEVMRDLRVFCKTAPLTCTAAEQAEMHIPKIAGATGPGPTEAMAANAPPLPSEPAPPLPTDILRTVRLKHYDGRTTQARIWHRLTDGWKLAPLPDQSEEESKMEQAALMAEFPIILDRLEETMPTSPGFLKRYAEIMADNLSAHQGVLGSDTTDDPTYLTHIEMALRETEEHDGPTTRPSDTFSDAATRHPRRLGNGQHGRPGHRDSGSDDPTTTPGLQPHLHAEAHGARTDAHGGPPAAHRGHLGVGI